MTYKSTDPSWRDLWKYLLQNPKAVGKSKSNFKKAIYVNPSLKSEYKIRIPVGLGILGFRWPRQDLEQQQQQQQRRRRRRTKNNKEQQGTTRNNKEQQGTTRNNKEQQGTTRNNKGQQGTIRNNRKQQMSPCLHPHQSKIPSLGCIFFRYLVVLRPFPVPMASDIEV